MLMAALGGVVLWGTVAAQERQVVEMVAERFTFTPSRLEVPVGTTVEIHIRSEDTNHGFHLVNGLNVIVPKRRQGEAVVVFEAEAVGVYQFECSKLCGAGHNFMRGEIIVTASGEAEGTDGAGADSESATGEEGTGT